MSMHIKGEVDRNMVIVRDFNTPLTSMDRASRQKINKETYIVDHIKQHTRSNGLNC